ncbi:MAG: hypothetical protein WBA46_17755 [Thermomicrobiales bacterium]
MNVSIEILATSDVDNETQSWGIEMRDVPPTALGRPSVATPDKKPITDMKPAEPPTGALAAWTAKAAGYRDVRVLLWKLPDD